MARILLADDDDSFRKMLGLSLTKLGHDVAEVRNGKEAISVINKEPPDLLITDLVMPEKEGLETIDEVKRKHPSLKIIAMSGGGRVNATDYLNIARAMGADLVLAKPFSIDEMVASLSSLLGRAK
jgi:DNA-binding response OmpR family regulator